MTSPSPLKLITFWFDPSDAASLKAFEQLPLQWEEQSIAVDYKPLLAESLMHQHQQKPMWLSQLQNWPWLKGILAASIHQVNGLPNRFITEYFLQAHKTIKLVQPTPASATYDEQIHLLAQKLWAEAIEKGISLLPSLTKSS